MKEDMNYRFINKDSKKTIVLFHGTGGDENDLIFLGEQIDPKANLLGLRGRINERGMNRFFKRRSPGVFDIDNLVAETKYLDRFLKGFMKVHNLNPEDMTLIGFSNGANIIGSYIYHFGKVFHLYVMMHPMIPIKDFDIVDQNQNKILITAGSNDPLVPIEETKTLKTLLLGKQADLTLNIYQYGHHLSDHEIRDIKKWYKINQ